MLLDFDCNVLATCVGCRLHDLANRLSNFAMAADHHTRVLLRNAKHELDVVSVHGLLHGHRFIGGCGGNLQGIARLVEGKDIDEIESLLAGIRCRGNTSCPDQLARILKSLK